MFFSRRNPDQADSRLDRDPVELGLMGLGVVVLVGLLAAKSMLLSGAGPQDAPPPVQQSFQPGDEQMPVMSQGAPDRNVDSDSETTADEEHLPSSSVRAFAMRTPSIPPPLVEFECSPSTLERAELVQIDRLSCVTDVLSHKVQSTMRFILLGMTGE